MSEAWQQLGTPRVGGVLLIGDHASAAVPADIDLGIDPALLSQHIAIDIGVAEVAALLVRNGAVDAAILGGVSRLVVDCNRDEDAPGAVPIASDGHAIPGNALDHAGREARIARFFRPYHDHIAAVIAAHRPAMILSLHSFTPTLASDPAQARPWHVGVLYNEDARLAPGAIAAILTAAPGPSVRLWDAVQAGDLATARDLHERLMPVWDAIGVDNMPSLCKYAQSLQGVEAGLARKPTSPARDDQKRQVRAALAGLGLVNRV